jgi:hypothetical protein
MEVKHHYSIIYLFLVIKMLRDMFIFKLPDSILGNIFIFTYLFSIISGVYFCLTYKKQKDNLFPVHVFGGIAYLLLFFLFVIGESILS